MQIESSRPTVIRIINNMITQLRLCDMLNDVKKSYKDYRLGSSGLPGSG